MTAVMTDCFGDTVTMPDPQEAAKLFDEQAELIMPIGTPGQAIWIGTEADRKILRVDIDGVQAVPRCAGCPTARVVELEPGAAIGTYATGDGEIAHIPGGLARAGPEADPCPCTLPQCKTVCQQN